jgi:hypothetical protein
MCDSPLECDVFGSGEGLAHESDDKTGVACITDACSAGSSCTRSLFSGDTCRLFSGKVFFAKEAVSKLANGHKPLRAGRRSATPTG